MSEPLEDLIDWTLDVLADETARARDEAARVPAGEVRSLAFRLSDSSDETPALLRFLEARPGTVRAEGRPGLSREAAALAFHVLRTSLLTEACHRAPAEPLGDRTARLLLLLGLVLEPWRFGGEIVTEGPAEAPGAVLERMGGRALVVRRLQEMLEHRTRPLTRLPHPSARHGSFRFLTVAAATEAALAMYDDGAVRPEELAEVERLRSERGRAVLRLLSMASRADGSVGREENRTIRVLQECLGIPEEEGAWAGPDPTAAELRELFPTPEERGGLVAGLAAVIAADGSVEPQEETMVRMVGLGLGVPAPRVEELLRRAREAAEQLARHEEPENGTLAFD